MVFGVSKDESIPLEQKGQGYIYRGWQDGTI